MINDVVTDRFEDKSAIRFIENEFGVTIKVPKSKMNDVDTIIELEVK